MEKRNYNIDFLRILAAIMVLVYHVVNVCWTNIEPVSINQSLWIYNFFWGGGRLANNIFLIISAWHLCDREFRCKRIFSTWLTTFLYSIMVGLIFYIKDGKLGFLVNHLTPVLSSTAWYISMYIYGLMITPILNHILKFYDQYLLKWILLIFFLINSVYPSFFPKSNIRFGYIGWFAMVYLSIGYIKKYHGKNKVNRKLLYTIFIICWGITIGTYMGFDYFAEHCSVMNILKDTGFYANIYFADLMSAPCFLSALCLFFIFKDTKREIINRELKKFILLLTPVTIDIYILLSMQSPDKNLFWIEFLPVEYFLCGRFRLIKLYVMIAAAFFSAAFLGYIRKGITDKILKSEWLEDKMRKVDAYFVLR